jgi:hypothetical protein
MTTPRTDDTAPHLPWAQTHTLPYAAPSAQSEAVASATPDSAPALNPPTWSGRKTAVAAALAIGISSMGAVAAAAALPAGATQGDGQVQQGGFGPGGRQQGGFTPPGPRQRGTTQLPGTQLQQAPADPTASTT